MAQTPSLSILRQLIEGTESISRAAASAPTVAPLAETSVPTPTPPTEMPVEIEATPPESVKTEIAKPEPAKSEPVVPETAKPTSAKSEPAHPEPAAPQEKVAPVEAPVVVPKAKPAPEAPAPTPKPPAASTSAPVATPRNSIIQSNSFLKILAENAPVAMAIFDDAMKYLYANQRWLEFFKLEQTDVVGRSQYEVFPALHPGWKHVYERALSGQVVRSDRDTVNQAGHPVLYRWEVRPWRNVDTTVGGVMITCLSIPGVQSRDVAENNSSISAVPIAAEAGPGVWDLPLPTVALDAEGRVCRWSTATAALAPAGKLKENETHFWDLFSIQDDVAPLRSAILNAVHRAAAGEVELDPVLVPASDASSSAPSLPRHWQIVAHKSPAENAGVVALAIGLRQPPAAPTPPPAPQLPVVEAPKEDTEAEKILRQREARLRSVLDAAPCGLLVLDERGAPVFHNGRAASLLGRYMKEGQSVEDWLTQSCRDEQHRDEVVRLWREHVWRKQIPRTLTLTAADSVLREIELQPASIPGGGLLVLMNDVTENRRADELLRATEAKFRTLVHENPLPIVLSDRSGMVFEANAAAEMLTGRTRAELRRMAMEEWLCPDSHLARTAALREMTDRGDLSADLDITLNHREGTPVSSGLRMATVPDITGQPAGTIHFFKPTPPPQSIFVATESAEAIPLIPEVESFLKLPSSVVLLSTDFHGRLIEWSDEAELCFGLTQEESLGRGLHTLFRPSDASGFYSDLSAATTDGMIQPVEWMFLHPQHGRRTGRFVLQPCDPGGMAVSILSEDLQEEEEAGDFMGSSPAPQTQHEIPQAAPATGADAARQLERERFLMGETHHRVKNHLQIITSMLNLQLSMIHNDEAREALRSSQNRVRSIAELHQHLFSLAVGEGGTFAEFAQGLIKNLRDCYDMGEDRVTVDLDINDDIVPEERLMPLSLSLNEMVSNAFKHAFPDGRSGSLRITARTEDEHTELTVKDDGAGMPEEHESKHFSGLGMRILRVFAGQLGGEVRITSEPDQGSSFCLRFPKA